MATCSWCGTSTSIAASTCVVCGKGGDLTTPSRSIHVPLEFAAVGALFLLGGAALALPALRALPGTLAVFSQGEFGRVFGSLALAFLLVLILLGLVCAVCARLVYRGDPTGRLLSVIIAASLAAGLLVGDVEGSAVLNGWDLVVLLAGLGSLLVLLLSPNASTFFVSVDGSTEPAPVTAARSTILLLAVVLGILGIAFLPLATIDGKSLVVGTSLITVAALATKLSRELSAGSSRARVALTILLVVYGLLVMWSGQDSAAMFIPLSLAVGVISLLWLPEASQSHFSQTGASRSSSSSRDPSSCATGPRHGSRAGLTPLATLLPMMTPPSPPRQAETSEGILNQGQVSGPSLKFPARAAFRIELVAADPGDLTVQQSPHLNIRYDPQTWFPDVAESESPLFIGLIQTDVPVCLRGMSTLGFDRDRLVGVCFEGAVDGTTLGYESGHVAVWGLTLASVDTSALPEMGADSSSALIQDHQGVALMRAAQLQRPAVRGFTKVDPDHFVEVVTNFLSDKASFHPHKPQGEVTTPPRSPESAPVQDVMPDRLPQFQFVQLHDGGETCAPGLDLKIGVGVGRQPGALTPLSCEEEEEEEIVLRAAGLIRGFGVFDSDHNDHRLQATGPVSGHLEEVFAGIGEIVFTDRRAIGSLWNGSSHGRSVNSGEGRALVFSLAYRDIDTVNLVRRRPLVGGIKDTSVRLEVLLAPAVIDCEFRLRLDERCTATARLRQAEAAEVICETACRSRLLDATDPDERERLQRVLGGEREQSDTTVTAWLCDPDEA